MSKFMCHRILFETGGNKRDSTNFPSAASSARRTINAVDTYVRNEYIHIFIEIIRAPYFIEDTTKGIVKIVDVRVPPVNTVNYRFPSSIGFQVESTVPVAEFLHLLGKEGLNLDDGRLHPIDDLGAVRTIVGQEVDEPNRAGLPNVQIRGISGTQSSSIDMVAGWHIELYGRAEMNLIRRPRGRSNPDCLGQEDMADQKENGASNNESSHGFMFPQV